MHDHPDFPSVIGGWCIHFTQQNLYYSIGCLHPGKSWPSLCHAMLLFSERVTGSPERGSCVTERGNKPALNAMTLVFYHNFKLNGFLRIDC